MMKYCIKMHHQIDLYTENSEKCQCLIEVRNDRVDIPYCQLFNRQLRDEKGK